MTARAWSTGEQLTSHPWALALVAVTGLALARWGRHALAELGAVSVP